jgi:hypothetical protein
MSVFTNVQGGTATMKLLKLIIAYVRNLIRERHLKWVSVPLNRKRPSMLRQTLPIRENRRLTAEELAERNFDDNDA